MVAVDRRLHNRRGHAPTKRQHAHRCSRQTHGRLGKEHLHHSANILQRHQPAIPQRRRVLRLSNQESPLWRILRAGYVTLDPQPQTPKENLGTDSLLTGRNTLLCRSVHQNMVPFRPSVHCPHIGKTGGGYCTDDTTYTETVMQNYFTNAPYIPYGYKG